MNDSTKQDKTIAYKRLIDILLNSDNQEIAAMVIRELRDKEEPVSELELKIAAYDESANPAT